MERRARLFFLVAVVIAAGILVANLPLGALLHDRATVQGETARLAALRAADEKLTSEVRSLDEPAIIGQIAHEEYGLVTPGERPLVVLPERSGSRTAARDPLANNPIPSSDLLPSDAILDPGTQVAPPPAHGPGTQVAPPARGPGFWDRVINSLEFWHSLF